MLSATERMQRILTAPAKKLARIDNILLDLDEDAQTAVAKLTDARTVTITAASKHLSVSRPTVYEMIRNGRLETVVLSGSTRVTMRSITALLDGGRPADAKTVERIERTRRARTANLPRDARRKGGAA